jgi:hypothetical protein
MTEFGGEISCPSRSFTQGCEAASPQNSPHCGCAPRVPGDLQLASFEKFGSPRATLQEIEIGAREQRVDKPLMLKPLR